jgi:hypothetical protein
MIKKCLLLILTTFLCFLVKSQCVGNQTFTLTPPPVNGGYTPGQEVILCYTLESYTQTGSNWFEGFDLNLGNGWATATPFTSPNNCITNTEGQWTWETIVSSTATPVTIVGPGYFFDLNDDGDPGNDYGDSNSDDCTWTFCVKLKVANICSPLSLSIEVTAGSDGVWGSYTSDLCDNVFPNLIFNGIIISSDIIIMDGINHN